MIKDVIWDFDGTLFDTYPAIVDIFLEMFNRFGIIESREEVRSLLHQSLSETYDYFSLKYSIESDLLRIKFVEARESRDVPISGPFDGALQILEHVIDRGGKNFIYTNRGKSTYTFLKHAGHMQYFTEIITREDGFGRKPKPDCINYLVDKYSLDKKTTLMVGDREIDVQAGHNADIKSCYFNTHHLSIPIKPHIYIDSLPELIPYII